MAVIGIVGVSIIDVIDHVEVGALSFDRALELFGKCGYWKGQAGKMTLVELLKWWVLVRLYIMKLGPLRRELYREARCCSCHSGKSC